MVEGKDVVKLVKTASKNPAAASEAATAEARAEAKIVVQASSGVAAAWGIHHYLKYYVGAHFSWDTTRSCRPYTLLVDHCNLEQGRIFKFHFLKLTR